MHPVHVRDRRQRTCRSYLCRRASNPGALALCSRRKSDRCRSSYHRATRPRIGYYSLNGHVIKFDKENVKIEHNVVLDFNWCLYLVEACLCHDAYRLTTRLRKCHRLNSTCVPILSFCHHTIHPRSNRLRYNSKFHIPFCLLVFCPKYN